MNEIIRITVIDLTFSIFNDNRHLFPFIDTAVCRILKKIYIAFLQFIRIATFLPAQSEN